MAVAIALTQTLQATPLPGTQTTGNIGFIGGATLDTDSAGTATEVTSWINPVVDLDSGSFAGIPSYSSASFALTWNFNSGAVSNFWSAGGFTFNLTSSEIVAQSGAYPVGSVTVDGTGYVSGNGYAPTLMSWSFTAQDPAAQTDPEEAWTFSASAASLSTPDGGSTVMLLGLGLSGAALLRRKLSA